MIVFVAPENADVKAAKDGQIVCIFMLKVNQNSLQDSFHLTFAVLRATMNIS